MVRGCSHPLHLPSGQGSGWEVITPLLRFLIGYHNNADSWVLSCGRHSKYAWDVSKTVLCIYLCNIPVIGQLYMLSCENWQRMSLFFLLTRSYKKLNNLCDWVPNFQNICSTSTSSLKQPVSSFKERPIYKQWPQTVNASLSSVRGRRIESCHQLIRQKFAGIFCFQTASYYESKIATN